MDLLRRRSGCRGLLLHLLELRAGNEIEQFVVEAKKLGMGLDDVLNAVTVHWRRLGNAIEDETTRRGRKTG